MFRYAIFLITIQQKRRLSMVKLTTKIFGKEYKFEITKALVKQRKRQL